MSNLHEVGSSEMGTLTRKFHDANVISFMEKKCGVQATPHYS